MDPISPELVLVDPALAERARSRLPDPAEPKEMPVPVAPAPRPLHELRETLAPQEEPVERRPRRSLERRLSVLVAAGAVLVVAVLLLPTLAGGLQPSTPSNGEREVKRAAAPSPPAKPAPVEPSARPAPAPSPPASPAPVEPAARPAESVREPRRREAPTRLFVWLPQKAARYYHVRFLERGRTIFEAWPTAPRIEVPLRGVFRGRTFAFTRGRYRWVVQPAFGPRSRPRYGPPLVRSTWIVRS